MSSTLFFVAAGIVSVALAVGGYIVGTESFKGSNFFTYPLKLHFQKKWHQVIYLLLWLVAFGLLATAICMVWTASPYWLIAIIPASAILLVPLAMVVGMVLMAIAFVVCFSLFKWDI